jgi:general nucleoside transport system permease protein
MNERLRGVLLVAVPVAGAAALLHAVAPDASSAFWYGSVGSRNALLSGTLVRAIPLCILGVGLAIAFRAGVFNIGGEGQLLLGAVAATIVGLQDGAGIFALPAALLCAMLAGAMWAGIAGWLRARFGVLEVISTIMLNFVAMNLVSYLVRGPLQEPTRIYPQTSAIADAARLMRLGGDVRLHAGLLIAVAVSAAAWWFATRTAAGFRQRAAGTAPVAARMAGQIDVRRVTFAAMLMSGALAGLAGGIEVTGVTYALYENISPGYGFSAIAVAILARLNPVAVIPSALLFAVLETGALGMQRDAGVPSTYAAVLEATAILAVVAAHGWYRDQAGRRHVPEAA